MSFRLLGRSGAFCLLVVLSCALLSGCGASGGQQPGAETYPTEDIEFVVPATAGGDYDQWARLLAPFIEENLPGDVSVVVSNQPGAGGQVAANRMYSAEPDGTQIQIFILAGLAAADLSGEASFDLEEFVYLASVSNEPSILAVNGDSEIGTVEDLRESAPVKQAMVGFTSSDGVGTVILYEHLGIEYTPVLHEGGSEADLSVVRGDADATIRPIAAILPDFQSGDLKPILILSDERPAEGELGYEELRDTPTLVDAGYPDISTDFQFPRVIATVPGTPEEIKQVLADAFEAAINDPELAEQAEEADLVPELLNAEEATDLVNQTLDTFDKHRDILTEAIEENA